ncbi:MAG: hypothetical protein ACT4PL_04100 [Phycisphaerales bacterium]
MTDQQASDGAGTTPARGDARRERPATASDPTATARAVMQTRMVLRAWLRVIALLAGVSAFTFTAMTYPSFSRDVLRSGAGLLPPVSFADYFFWPVVLGGLAAMAFLADAVALKWIVPVPALRCPRCGYDVRGHTRGPCPECGLALGELAPSAVAEI